MTYRLFRSTAFIRAARKLVKRNPAIAPDLRNTLNLLSDDPFHPSLRTHKLKGQLSNSWACSVTYEIRIVFAFVKSEGQDGILLESVGTHEEIY